MTYGTPTELWELVIGPQSENAGRIPDAQAAWERVRHGLVLPLTPLPTVTFSAVDQPCNGTAETQLKGSVAIITLAEEFFALEQEQQSWVLWHEIAHVHFLRLLAGRQAWLDDYKRRTREQMRRRGFGFTAAETQRQWLALTLWSIPDEMLVEALFATSYPAYAAGRASMYSRRWAARDPLQQVTRVVETLKVYAVLLEWSRAELALRLTETAETVTSRNLRDALNSLGQSIDSRWETLKPRALKLLAVDTSSASLDDAAADGLRDDVLRIQL